jgi:hypothetical protein
MAATRDEVIEKAARDLRIETGVDERFLPDLIFVMNELKRLGRIKDYKRVPDDQMPGKFARWDENDRLLYLSESTFRALDHPLKGSKKDRRRARFTAAHELAHVACEHEGVHDRDMRNTRRKDDTLRSQVWFDEVEANRFAAAFLVPAHLADPTKHVEDLADLFDVNDPVVTFRKPVLERMDRRARGDVPALPQSVVDLLRDAEKKGHKVISLRTEEERRRKKDKPPRK